MKKIVLLAFLGLILAAAQTCPQGQIKINGACVAVTYIPGCASYTAQGFCNVCEYGYLSVDGVCQATDKPTTQCCVLTDNNGVCQQCAPGLYLDGNSCLKVVRPGCLEGKGNLCSNCANGYQNINGRCYRAISSCLTYSSQGQCTQCASGFEVIRGVCSPVASAPLVPNCLLTNEYGCVRCSEGFYLTRNRNCVQNQIGCIKHFREECQVCLPQFKLINGKCLMDGCKAYGTYGCTSCSSQYSLVDGVCQLDNCLESLNGQCVACHKDYRFKNGVCVKSIADRCTSCANGYFVGQDGRCYKNIIGCQIYAADGTCATCADVFVNNLGVCVIPGCETLGSQGCQVCQSPFKLSSGRCYLDNCNEHNYITRKCKSCKVGYHVQSGVCVLNKPLCASYTSNGDDEVCSSCVQSDSYILTDTFTCEPKKPGCVYQYGKCISCAYPFRKVDTAVCVIDGCAKYSLVGCQVCTLPFQLNLGSCVIANCEQITNNACTRCTVGYHLSSNGQCVLDDSKCTSYLGDYCQSCISGYKVSKQGVCVREIANCNVLSVDGCLQCTMGYQYVVNQCVLTDKYCSVFDSRGKGCSRCVSGYHTENGICVINDVTCAVYSDYAFTQSCSQCATNYIFTSDGTKCVQKVAGCIYDNRRVCSSCRDPFKLVGNKCVITGCLKYSDSGCYQCDYPFQMNGNQCVISFCQSYDGNTCSVCQNGYKLIQGQCYRVDPKCTEYNTNGQCRTCINEYIVFQGTCVKKDNNCQVYSKLGGCNTCRDGYYLSLDNNCLPQEPGCVYKQGKCTYCNYPFKFNEKSLKCRIEGCLQAVSGGCTKCQFPYTLAAEGVCQITNCLTTVDNHCVRCSLGYHLKQGMTCVLNDINCLQYNDDGDCQVCAKGYLRMSSGECAIAQDNCIDKKKSGECLACKDGYYLNTFFQCQQKDKYCQQYINGVCTKCDEKHFLYQLICFPYSPGCVAYSGKDCVRCKSAYTLKNGECFNLKKPSLQLQGNGDQYDFDINPIDITKSKYYIDNLSPISKLGKVFYSSFQTEYIDARLISENQNIYSKGWKAENARSGEYIGYTLDDNTDPLTFYAIQISDVEGNYISSFYIEYSVDGVTYTRVSHSFDSSNAGKNLTTIYFTGIYAKAIRIVVKGYYGWPAARIEFFYYDTIRFRKISNLKSLTYLKESIESNFVDRMDNQMYINQRIYFQPNKTCLHSEVCFTGLQLCQAKRMNSLTITSTGGVLKSVYIMYSTDGVNYGCFEKCRYVLIDQTKEETTVLLNQLACKNIRVYPIQYTGTPSIHIAYSYS